MVEWRDGYKILGGFPGVQVRDVHRWNGHGWVNVISWADWDMYSQEGNYLILPAAIEKFCYFDVACDEIQKLANARPKFQFQYRSDWNGGI